MHHRSHLRLTAAEPIEISSTNTSPPLSKEFAVSSAFVKQTT